LLWLLGKRGVAEDTARMRMGCERSLV
jgi:hypothetical protein